MNLLQYINRVEEYLNSKIGTLLDDVLEDVFSGVPYYVSPSVSFLYFRLDEGVFVIPISRDVGPHSGYPVLNDFFPRRANDGDLERARKQYEDAKRQYESLANIFPGG